MLLPPKLVTLSNASPAVTDPRYIPDRDLESRHVSARGSRMRVSRMREMVREEIFGPVAAAIPFEDENDAILQGNDTTYGLAAAVWTRDISRAHRVARALKAGTVWVNCYGVSDTGMPFGGYKQSGFGREGGKHVLDVFTQLKSVYVKL